MKIKEARRRSEVSRRLRALVYAKPGGATASDPSSTKISSG